jgi:DNA (cytosine-5)-methyltransferase 1
MARAGLGAGWRCTFANDFDEMKAATYRENWGADHLVCGDVANVKTSDLPGIAELSWASFPCQDLSLAGDYRGLGRADSAVMTRSGTFWPFWGLMQELVQEGRAPRLIVLENVYGALTSHGGKDFAAISLALSSSGYRFGAVVINARLFLPQSRPRVFFIAVRHGERIPVELIGDGPQMLWHPAALKAAYAALTVEARKQWVWWNINAPGTRNTVFLDLIEDTPTAVDWHTPTETQHILDMMSPGNKAKVAAAIKINRKIVGGVYRRTRPDEKGAKRQRAEVRFDDMSGCLRTPAGGSSRQTILVIEGDTIRSRLLSPREAARLMGLDDSYRLPNRYNDAYHVAGDGVCVFYVGQSVDGIRARVNRHLISARSDIIANRQVDVWEIAWVWAYLAKAENIAALEDALFYEFHPKSALMNGKTPRATEQKTDVPKPLQIVQVMADSEIAEKKDPALRLPRQAEHYSQIVGHFLAVKNSREIAGAIQAHFERLQKYHRELLGLATEIEGDTGEE